MGFGPFSNESKSEAYDQRQGTAGSRSPILSGYASNLTEAGGLTIRGNSQYSEAGSVNLGNSVNAQVGKSNVALKGNKNTVTVSIYDTNPDVLEALKAGNASLRDQSESALKQIGTAFDSALSQYSALAQTKDSTAIVQKPILWLGLGFLVVAAIFFWGKKS